VMRNGKVVEEGPAGELFARPQSDYTRALFAAAFNLEAVPVGEPADVRDKDVEALKEELRTTWDVPE
jgi:ABC-type dipeptide/oligopeptide/nickel transport system ATPase component